MTTNLNTAIAAWGPDMPDWVRALAEACDRINQKHTAGRIRYSAPVVNAVLKNNYNGNSKRVQTAIEGALMASTVECPVAGELAADVCLQYQKRPFAATNPERVKLYRACRGGCRYSQIGRPTTTEGDGDENAECE